MILLLRITLRAAQYIQIHDSSLFNHLKLLNSEFQILFCSYSLFEKSLTRAILAVSIEKENHTSLEQMDKRKNEMICYQLVLVTPNFSVCVPHSKFDARFKFRKIEYKFTSIWASVLGNHRQTPYKNRSEFL